MATGWAVACCKFNLNTRWLRAGLFRAPQTADGYGQGCNRLFMVRQTADGYGLVCVGYPKQPTATGWAVTSFFGSPNSWRLRAGLFWLFQTADCYGLGCNRLFMVPQIADVISSNTLALSGQSYLGRQAAHPTAVGRVEELRARTTGVRLPLQGAPSHHLRRIHPYFWSCSTTGTNGEQSDWRT